MALRYKRRLIQHLKHDSYEPKGVEALAAELRIEEPHIFAEEVQTLVDAGEVDVDSAGRVRLPSLGSLDGEVIGEFKGTDRGFGFVRTESMMREGDIFIPPGSTLDAMTGDRVRVAISGRSSAVRLVSMRQAASFSCC